MGQWNGRDYRGKEIVQRCQKPGPMNQQLRQAWGSTSVICQIDLQVFAGFLGFPGFRKPGNLETSKLKLTNYTVQHLVINRLRIPTKQT